MRPPRGKLNFKQTKKKQYKCTQYVSMDSFIYSIINHECLPSGKDSYVDSEKEQPNIVFQIPRMRLKVICLNSRYVKTGKGIAFISYFTYW